MTAKLFVIAPLAAVMTACVSVLPEPEGPDALYSIEAKADLAGLSHDLVVREPEGPRLISGQGMVSKGSDGGQRFIAGAEWSGPATRQVQLAIIDTFKTGETGAAVPAELGIFADFELASELTVLQLEGNTATCKLVASLIQSNDRSLVARREITARQTASSGATNARALALQSAAANCAEQAGAFAITTLQDLD